VTVLIFLSCFVFFIYELRERALLMTQVYQLEEINMENEILKAKVKNLKKEIAELGTGTGIEKVARVKLRLVKPGEIVIRPVK
jgi:cell division protein FtsB